MKEGKEWWSSHHPGSWDILLVWVQSYAAMWPVGPCRSIVQRIFGSAKSMFVTASCKPTSSAISPLIWISPANSTICLPYGHLQQTSKLWQPNLAAFSFSWWHRSNLSETLITATLQISLLDYYRTQHQFWKAHPPMFASIHYTHKSWPMHFLTFLPVLLGGWR